MIAYPDIDPIAVSIGPLDVRWYGLTYLAAFAVACDGDRLAAPGRYDRLRAGGARDRARARGRRLAGRAGPPRRRQSGMVSRSPAAKPPACAQ